MGGRRERSKLIIYDDYNSKIRPDQNTIGTLTSIGLIMYNKSKPKLVGGFGNINFGKQYRQGNRVYDSNKVVMCLNAAPVGNMDGYSYLYLITKYKK